MKIFKMGNIFSEYSIVNIYFNQVSRKVLEMVTTIFRMDVPVNKVSLDIPSCSAHDL
jgi:hypothetical protein